MKLVIENSPISKLSLEIISDILSILPTRSILSCKLVCKGWCSIIRNPHFKMSSKSLVLIIRRIGNNHANKNLHLIEPNNDYTLRIRNKESCLFLSQNSVTKFNDNGFDGYPVKLMSIVNSCKSLVCLSFGNYEFRVIDPSYLNGEWEPFFVCNPITSDYVVVRQPLPFEADQCSRSHVGFGFSGKSSHYKLVRFFHYSEKMDDMEVLVVEVFNIGSGDKWRMLDSGPPQGYSWCGNATFFESSLHWIIINWKKKESQIATFDCEDEVFVSLDLPNGLDHMHEFRPNMELSIMQSQMCLCIWNIKEEKSCDIWVMDKYGVKESWRKLFVVSLGESPPRLMPLKPLGYLNNREILMLSVTRELVSYDVRSNRWKAIKVPGVTAMVDAMVLDPTFLPADIILSCGAHP